MKKAYLIIGKPFTISFTQQNQAHRFNRQENDDDVLKLFAFLIYLFATKVYH